MVKEVLVRLVDRSPPADLEAVLVAAGKGASARFNEEKGRPGVHLLLGGDRDYYVVLRSLPPGDLLHAIEARRRVLVVFAKRKPIIRRVVAMAAADHQPHAAPPSGPEGGPAEAPAAGPIDLTAGLHGAAPLFLLPDGRISNRADGPPAGSDLMETLVTAARWVSSRRTSTFERLFPPSAFHPDVPVREERLSAAQAAALLGQLKEALAEAGATSRMAREAPAQAAQTRSAALTVLSHIIATSLKDPSFAQVAEEAAREIFTLIEGEQGESAVPALRGHAIQLLKMRAPALSEAHRGRAALLLRDLIREAPPYDDLGGPWRFAMCSAFDFHEGECDILERRYGFTRIDPPEGTPKAPGWRGTYDVLEAPFRTPAGEPIQIFARVATPRDENTEMGDAFFIGVAINRHAQLGAYDMQASLVEIKQVGYKLMFNSQCAGLTTRYAISRIFPDADIYSSWDSTYFQTDRKTGKVSASEGLDCFVALLGGMSRRETHAELEARIKKAQWYHKHAEFPGFVQFIGPANPQMARRFSDVNQDGRADFYDGFLDLSLRAISQDIRASATPRDPGVPASQIGGEAARGLDWAAGSLNRVTQYSDIWEGLPGQSELFYSFRAAGFYSHTEPPFDVPIGAGAPAQDLSRLPALCRYINDETVPGGLCVDVMIHSHLAHAAGELKRLLCAAEAMWRAMDLGYLPREGLLGKPIGQRGAVLLTLAGLLEFPADQNFIDGLWSMALEMLNMPPLSRSVVRRCITDADHDASNYYGSWRGLRQLVGEEGEGGELRKSDEVAFVRLASDDPLVGRARELTLPA